MSNILLDIGIIMIFATITGLLARLLKQPLIPAYIISGVIIGPVLGLITDAKTIMTLSEIGIAFLLFIVGMELDLKRLREIGSVAIIGGTLQVMILFVMGALTSIFLRFGIIESIYLGLILAFSSTMVIVKILSDRSELDTLHGRIIIGFLLIQDIFAILAMTLLDKMGGAGSNLSLTLLIGAGLIIVAFILGKMVFPKVFHWAAHSQELLFLLAVSTCLAFAIIFSYAGFSIIIGSFIAGIILGNLPFNIEIISRVTPLKDFFSVLFFVAIGLQLNLASINNILTPIIIFLIFEIIISPIVTVVICSLFGYKRRTAFMTGITMTQLSGFSLIIVVQGFNLGLISDRLFSITIVLAIITITITSYLIKYEKQLYKMLSRYLVFFERISRINKELSNINDEKKHEVVLVGYDRTGYSIFKTLKRLKKNFVVVDFDPDIIKKLIDENIPCIYGDIGDVEIIEKLHLETVDMVISTIPDHEATILLIKKFREKNPSARIIVTSNTAEDALELYDNGADYVIIPHYLGGDHVSLMLEEISDDIDKLIRTKIEHIKSLHERWLHHRRKIRHHKV